MVAVSSGKGGVGKSTIAANLAVALAAEGAAVGLIDSDIYGPNIPGMLGHEGRPAVDPGSNRIKPGRAHGIRIVSMGMLIDPGVPVIWRGPMLAKMMNQFLFQVDWGGYRHHATRPPAGNRGRADHPDPVRPPHRGRHRHHALRDRPGGRAPRGSDVSPDRGPTPRTDREHVRSSPAITAAIAPTCSAREAGRSWPGAFGIDLLAQLPLDPRIGRCADEGTPFAAAHGDDPAAELFLETARTPPEASGEKEGLRGGMRGPWPVRVPPDQSPA